MASSFRPPFTPSPLESERVKLVPFSLEEHGETLFAMLAANPGLSALLPITLDRDFLEKHLQEPTVIVFAVLDKTKSSASAGYAYAGVIGLANTSASNLATEVGPVLCFPAFQRTFVMSNAAGILVRYCLDTPAQGGLGYRRVFWKTDVQNLGSIKLAQRVGMKREGTLRWDWVLPANKDGADAPNERGEGKGRHTAVLAVCWDDWEDGGRELVAQLIARP